MLGAPGVFWSPSTMFGRYRAACKIVVSLLLAACLSTVPTYPVSQAASDACTTGDDVRATTCRLLDGSIESLRGRLDGPGAATTYRLNVLGPGTTETPMLPAFEAALGDALYAMPCPLDRRSTADEQARALLFLNDPANASLTGAVLFNDGGMSAALGTARLATT